MNKMMLKSWHKNGTPVLSIVLDVFIQEESPVFIYGAGGDGIHPGHSEAESGPRLFTAYYFAVSFINVKEVACLPDF